MSLLLHGDCLEHMKNLDADSVDLVFCDLPYGQTSCKWDCPIDLEQFWVQIMRIKKLRTPIFMTTTTKFGVSLIQSAPKKCHFRYDIVWMKSAPCGFLSAKKMPMRKHEMIYVFYEKLPFYDLSSHQHKFIKEVPTKRAGNDGVDNKGMIKNRSKSGMETLNKYDPPLPVSIIKEGAKGNCYNTEKRKKPITRNCSEQQYDPPLPVSVVKEDEYKQPTTYGKNSNKNYNKNHAKEGGYNKNQVLYDPPLPVSIVKEEDGCYGEAGVSGEGTYKGKHNLENNMTANQGGQKYEPPLPVSVVKEEDGCYGEDMRPEDRIGGKPLYDPPLPVSVVKETQKENSCYGGLPKTADGKDAHSSQYDPPLPTTMLDIKSTRGKHSTEKPVALMEWIFKYYSKEGDVVLDPTMGSGSTGVACKNMNRNFIGIEMDAEIFEVACGRIE